MGKTSAKTPKILVVDDESAILNALGFFLEQEGYEVETTDKFDSYLSGVPKTELPDAIILDILLNQEDGVKIAKGLKADSKTRHIPIILISALPNAKKLSQGSGADVFLAKPFDVNELNETIERVIKRPKARLKV